MINTVRMTAEFLELVRIDSVSGRERELADLLKTRLGEMGLEALEDSAGDSINTGTGNIIARLPSNGGGGGPLMLCAHMDTVEPGCGVNPVVEGGVVRSSGNTILGGDDKAGIAIILEALRVIRESGVKHGDIDVVFTVFEEGGLLGAIHLDPGLLKARMGYVLDSGGPPGTIITSAPTQDKISAVIKGRAAHAGVCPEKGINAIEVAAKAIASMTLGRIDSETTANIGIISGGKAINIVPDSVLIEGETRSLSSSKKDALTGHIAGKLEEAAKYCGAVADIRIENLYREFSLGEQDRVVAIALEAGKRIGLNTALQSTGGGSDANIFNEKGIATANLGIGMQQVHTTEEYISLADIEACCRFVVEIIKTAGEI